jgi:ATP-dependent Clp protease ATP-binding subunit ClpA
METLLKERIFGQDEAIQMILTAFRAHDKKKPLTFHFAGDNGVGKSFTAKTIAESLFQYGNPSSGDFEGFLYLRGEHYQGLEHLEEYRQTITRRIVDQLVQCPNSLIVFDEVEFLAPQTVSVISAFLDDSIPTFQYSDNVKCRTNEATFIVISDFGMEGRTNSMSFQQVKTLVERDSTEFWINPKQPSVITHIIPFMPLDAKARTSAAHYQLGHLVARDIFKGRNVRSLEFTTGGAEAVADLSAKAYPSQNGRGVTKYLESYVLPQIVVALDRYESAQRAQRTPPSKNSVALRVSARTPMVEFHRAQFDVAVEQAKLQEKRESAWRRFIGITQEEL